MNLIESSVSIQFPSSVIDLHLQKRGVLLDYDYDDSDSSNIPTIEDHDELLEHSLRIAKYWSLLVVPFSIYGSMRWYVWILYAQSLGENDETTLAFTVYACYFLQGISSMWWSWISDKYQYDTIAIVLAVATVCAVFIECIAPNFNILVTGTMLICASRGILGLILAFVAKYLPNDYAIQYTSYIYAVGAAAYLVGPVISGIITHYFNLRAVYVACTIIMALCLLYVLCFISRTQKPLEMKQRRMRALYDALPDDHEDEEDVDRILCENNQFPVCIKRYGLMEQKIDRCHPMDSSFVLSQRLMDDNGQIIVNEALHIETTAVSGYIWFMMINITISNACLLGIEGVTSTYYLVYCSKQFNESIITSTMQIALFVLLFVGSSVITPPLLRRCYGPNQQNIAQSNKSYKYEYVVLFIGHCVSIPLFLYLWQRIQDIDHMIWMVMCAVGISLGITNMTQEVMLLEFQPKQHCGKVSGAKIMARQFMKAFGCLVVGILWTDQILWFVWVMGYLYVISLFLTLLMFITQKCKLS